jgi:adenylate kinase
VNKLGLTNLSPTPTPRLAEDDCKQKGVLLDGFPRTKVQAEVLDGILKKNGMDIDVVVFLEVNEESLVERVCGRRIDPESGESYHITFNPPPADIADKLIQRDDDTEEKVKVRLQGFNKNVAAISGFYEAVGLKVDGNKKPEEVEVAVEEAIRSKVGK